MDRIDYGKDNALFSQLFLSEVEKLKSRFYRAILDLDNREAFNLLIRAWCYEDTAMPITLC